MISDNLLTYLVMWMRGSNCSEAEHMIWHTSFLLSIPNSYLEPFFQGLFRKRQKEYSNYEYQWLDSGLGGLLQQQGTVCELGLQAESMANGLHYCLTSLYCLCHLCKSWRTDVRYSLHLNNLSKIWSFYTNLLSGLCGAVNPFICATECNCSETIRKNLIFWFYFSD